MAACNDVDRLTVGSLLPVFDSSFSVGRVTVEFAELVQRANREKTVCSCARRDMCHMSAGVSQEPTEWLYAWLKCLLLRHQTKCSNKQGDMRLPLLCWIMRAVLGRTIYDRMFSLMRIIMVMTVVVVVLVLVVMVMAVVVVVVVVLVAVVFVVLLFVVLVLVLLLVGAVCSAVVGGGVCGVVSGGAGDGDDDDDSDKDDYTSDAPIIQSPKKMCVK